MVIKQIFLDEKGRQQLKNGINKISDAVASTLGPGGQTVLIESEHHVGGVTVTKDGVTVAKSINLYNPVENLAVQLVREAASNTAKMAGDGTTTSIVLTRDLIDSYDWVTRSYDKYNKTEVLRSIQKICDELVDSLDKMAKPVLGKRLLDVATISANNDPVIGKLIADVYEKVKFVTVENNTKTNNTYSEIINGIRVQRGWTSRHFITDHKKMECVFEDAYVLITDHEITNLAHIESILKRVVSERIPLLVIGQLAPQVAATINMNVLEKKIRFCNIIPPSMGYRKDELMEDIAVSLGGHYYSQATGDNLSLCTFDGLGKAKKIIIGQDSTVIVPDEMYVDNNDVYSHVSDLKMLIEEEKDESYINFLNERIANISGGIGIIYVGADSDIEQKELRDRVDDAVLAVKAAIDEGILPGGGISLINALNKLRTNSRNYSIEREIAIVIMDNVVKSPLFQICRNAGVDPEECYLNVQFTKDGYGYDVKNNRYGDMIKMGIIDPAKVTKNAIKNAVSVATTILSTNAIITNVRENESVE